MGDLPLIGVSQLQDSDRRLHLDRDSSRVTIRPYFRLNNENFWYDKTAIQDQRHELRTLCEVPPRRTDCGVWRVSLLGPVGLGVDHLRRLGLFQS